MYTEYYGLKADPFRMSPDHSFCYRHASFSKAKAYMQFALHREEGFVVITGGPGTGKTTLIGDLISDYHQTDFDIAKLVGAKLEGDDLLRMVSHAFGVPFSGTLKSGILNHLCQYVTDIYKRKRRPLLIVDEAQGLARGALEELRLLTNLQIDGKPLLQIFLVGQSELRDLILDPTLEQLHQRIIATCHLKALEPKDTVSYVMHRLKCTGWAGRPMINIEIFPDLYNFSRGIPRRINLAFSRLLLNGSLEEKNWLDASDIRLVVDELREEDLFPGNPGAAIELNDFDLTELLTLVQPSKPKVTSTIAVSEASSQVSITVADSREEEPTSIPDFRQIKESNSQPGLDRVMAASVNPDDENGEDVPGSPEGDDADRKKTAAETPEVRSTDEAPYTLPVHTVHEPGSGESVEIIDSSLTSYSKRPWYRWSVAASLAFGLILIGAILVTGPFENFRKKIIDTTWLHLGASQGQNLASNMRGDDLSVQRESEVQKPFISDLEIPALVLDKLDVEHRSTFSVLAKKISEHEPDQDGDEGHESVIPVHVKTEPPEDETIPKVTESRVEENITAENHEDSLEQRIQKNSQQVSATSNSSVLLHHPEETLPVWHTGAMSGEVLFEFNSVEIDPEYQLILEGLAATLVSSEAYVAHIFGYTDSVGDSSYNTRLSKRRADSVARYLMDKGVKERQLLVEGRGAKSVVPGEDLNKQRAVVINIEMRKTARKILSAN